LAGLTRLDLPLLLGTIVTEVPDRARVAGFFIRVGIGQDFAFGYAGTVALSVRLPLLTGVDPRMASAQAGGSLGRSGSSRQGCWGSTTGPTAVTVASIVVALSCSRVSEEFVAGQDPVYLTARVGS
jgi:hypothetical protein